jgi:hypothetical protein
MEKHNITQPPPLKTLSTCLNKALQDGYKENFKATGSGIESVETGKAYKPEDLHVVDFYRFEGASDPADSAILYVIEAPDGAKGTLVDSYGAYSDPDVAKMVTRINYIEKHSA